MALGHCGAFTEDSVLTARGGRRHRRCRNDATTQRTYTKVSTAWRQEVTVDLCGQHAAMFDRGGVRLESYERRKGR